jgi:hypothetical protein
MTTSATSQADATSPVRVRASDADRNVTVELLQDAITRGLLTHDEGGARMAAAFAATYRDELPPLTADLPPAAPAPRAAAGWSALGAALVAQLRHEVRATRAAGIRSKRFVITALVTLCLIALVVAGIVGALHVAPGFDGGGRGFHGGR